MSTCCCTAWFIVGKLPAAQSHHRPGAQAWRRRFDALAIAGMCACILHQPWLTCRPMPVEPLPAGTGSGVQSMSARVTTAPSPAMRRCERGCHGFEKAPPGVRPVLLTLAACCPAVEPPGASALLPSPSSPPPLPPGTLPDPFPSSRSTSSSCCSRARSCLTRWRRAAGGTRSQVQQGMRGWLRAECTI